MEQVPVEQEPSGLQLSLDILATKNVYAGFALRLYYDALESHQEGRDLEEFLKTIKWPESAMSSAYNRQLNDTELAFIMAGQSSNNPGTDYSKRLGFILNGPNLMTQRALSALNRLDGKESPTLEKQYMAALNSGTSQADEFYPVVSAKDYGSASRRLLGLDLDSAFDQAGRNNKQVEALNIAMTILGIQQGEPEVVKYFLPLIEDAQKKIDLYFKALSQPTSGALQAQEILGDLKSALQSDPISLCDYLIREIAEIGSQQGVDVRENRDAVMTLTADKTIFRDDLVAIVNRTINDSEDKLSLADQTRYKLIDALMKDRQIELAEEIIKDFTAKDLEWEKEIRNFAIRRHKEGLLPPESKSNRRLNKIGMAVLGTIPGIRKRQLRRQASNLLESKTHAVTTRQTLYSTSLSPRANDFSQERVEIIQKKAVSGDSYVAYSSFIELLQDDNQPILVKLEAAIDMASSFDSLPDSDLDKRASIEAGIELLDVDLQDQVVLPDIISKSKNRQETEVRVNELINKIQELADRTSREDYLKELAALPKE